MLEHTQDGKDRGKDGQRGSDQVDPHKDGLVLGAVQQAIEVGGRIAVSTPANADVAGSDL